MLKAVELRNFKNFRHQRIELEKLTVFVGANASGKTSVLEAIQLAISAAWRQDSQQPHLDWLYTRGGSGDLSITCTTVSGTLAVFATPVLGLHPPAQIEYFGKASWPLHVMPSEVGALQKELTAAGTVQYLKLNARALSGASYSDHTPPRMNFDGGSLASVLAYMALNDPDGFAALLEQMCKLIPSLRRIRFTKTAVHRFVTEEVRIGDDTPLERHSKREFQGDQLLFDFANAANLSAETVSEGTLILLGLLTVLLGPSPPGILLLDDIEHGLHPLAQQSLLGAIARIMERFPNLQVLATAYSPYLVDSLRPEQVRLLAIGSDGFSICGRLAEHPQFDKWKNEMAPGELWSLFGEKWVAEGGKAKG